MTPLRFPTGFTWGVATAAPQIEGAAFADGKGASVGDTCSRQPGAVLTGDTRDGACEPEKSADENTMLVVNSGETLVLQAGKRKFLRIHVSG